MACFIDIGKKSPYSLGITKDPEYPKAILRKNRARDITYFLTSKYITERHDCNEGSHEVPVFPHLRYSLNTGGGSPMARLLGGAPGATSLWNPGSQARDQAWVPTLATIIQHIFGNPSHSKQRRKRNKRNPDWKRSETHTVCRWHDMVHIKH